MIGSSDNRVSYDGNGIATEFAYTFKILEKSDINVLHVAADGTETLLTKDYYVDMEKSVVLYPGYAPGAEIPESERPPILPEGERLVLYREVPITQESALDKHWPFNVVENGLDKLTIICQQMWDRLQRSFYVSEATSTNFDTKIPIEAGKTFRVKDDGTGFEVTEDPGKVIDGAKALLKQTTEQAEFANEQAVNAQNAANAAEAVAPEYAKTKEVLDNIVSYTNTATEQASIATAKADAANVSATNAAQSYANADAIATQLTEYLATKETLTAPAVDKTLLIEGAAADSKVVGELKSDLDEIKEAIGFKTVSFVADWVEKKFLDNNCIYTDSANSRQLGNDTFDVSDIIGKTINVFIDNNYTLTFTYGFTTNTDLKIERVQLTETAEITVPQNAKNFRYFILAKDTTTIEKSKETTVVVYEESDLVLQEIKQNVVENKANIFSLNTDVEGLKKSVTVIEKQSISLEQGTLNTTNGANQVATTYLRSIDFFPIKNLNIVRFSSGFRVRAYEYYEDKTFVGTVALYNGLQYFDTINGDIEASKYVFNPNTKYIRFTITKLPSADIVPSEVSIAECDYEFEILEKVAAIEDQLNSQHNDMLAYACNKVLCIGDSLTSGAYYGKKELWPQTGVSIDQNYPRVLGRMLNTQVTNAGVSGINAINWYANEYGKYNMREFDTFVIWLGTNGGYTDTLDADVNQYDDFNDYAETNTGCLCKIIENIRLDNPNHLMVILDLFVFTESIHNEVLAKISSKYNIPIIQMSDLTTQKHLEMHYGEEFLGNDGIYRANPHFNKYGNIVIADRVKHGISEYLASDVLKCDFGLTQRTN